MVDLDDVARVCLGLPDVTEGETRGNRRWMVSGKMFAWERPFTKADIRRFGDETPPDGPIVGVRVEDLSEKEAVLQAGQSGVFTISHFDGYAAILVQLDAVDPDTLHETLVDGWLACAPPNLAQQYLDREQGPPRDA
jgi:hypothetical protein